MTLNARAWLAFGIVAGVLYVLGTPLALASYWGFVPLAALAPFVLWRLLDEERILTRTCPDTRNTGSASVIASCRWCGEDSRGVDLDGRRSTY